MKKLFFCLLLSLTYNAYCEIKDTDPTILEKLFSQEFSLKEKIAQEKEGNKRELTPIGREKEKGFKKYLLTERNLKDETSSSVYIVSKKGIEPDQNLFDIPMAGARIIYFDKMTESNTGKGPQGKITLKWKDAEYDMNEPFSKLPINSDITTEICVDHWWVTWNEDTGEIISIESLGSDCYVVGPLPSTGGGAGSNPSPNNCDPSAVYPEQEEFNNYIQMTITPATSNVPATSAEQDDLITGSFVWTVATGAIPSWRVDAVTSYSYHHDKFYDINLGVFEHIYNIVSYRTSEPYFVGTNYLITSTYISTSVTDNIFKNNSANAHGKTQVYGRVKHIYKVGIRTPFCEPLNLESIDEVANSLTFLPQ